MLPIQMRQRAADPFEMMTREMERLLNARMPLDEISQNFAPYAVDVHEDNDHFYIDAELPGFRKEDIDLTLENGILTIRAQRQETTEQQKPKGQPLHRERRWTQFQRTFSLPTAVDENRVEAKLEGGVLEITLNKREEVKPRKIQITVGQQGESQKLGAGAAKPATPAASAPTSGNGGAKK